MKKIIVLGIVILLSLGIAHAEIVKGLFMVGQSGLAGEDFQQMASYFGLAETIVTGDVITGTISIVSLLDKESASRIGEVKAIATELFESSKTNQPATGNVVKDIDTREGYCNILFSMDVDKEKKSIKDLQITKITGCKTKNAEYKGENQENLKNLNIFLGLDGNKEAFTLLNEVEFDYYTDKDNKKIIELNAVKSTSKVNFRINNKEYKFYNLASGSTFEFEIVNDKDIKRLDLKDIYLRIGKDTYSLIIPSPIFDVYLNTVPAGCEVSYNFLSDVSLNCEKAKQNPIINVKKEEKRNIVCYGRDCNIILEDGKGPTLKLKKDQLLCLNNKECEADSYFLELGTSAGIPAYEFKGQSLKFEKKCEGKDYGLTMDNGQFLLDMNEPGKVNNPCFSMKYTNDGYYLTANENGFSKCTTGTNKISGEMVSDITGGATGGLCTNLLFNNKLVNSWCLFNPYVTSYLVDPKNLAENKNPSCKSLSEIYKEWGKEKSSVYRTALESRMQNLYCECLIDSTYECTDYPPKCDKKRISKSYSIPVQTTTAEPAAVKKSQDEVICCDTKRKKEFSARNYECDVVVLNLNCHPDPKNNPGFLCKYRRDCK
ncbi:MAG: hypothetical protein PHG05_01875 [Candidatus Nanoarchaeia archaeon]|nr:hypothetical protein [Candidatus Nanoarchaeia archaeon]